MSAKNPFREAQYYTSAPSLKECPPEGGVEIAFAGRSNAGKSSAINRLTENTKLAKTSKTPGRTQLINYFSLPQEGKYLVDLPGYGFAKVPAAVKAKWQANLSAYLQKRESLVGLILLMDCRHPLQAFDTMMLGWAASAGMPIHVLLTKADKLKRGAAKSALLSVERYLTQEGLGGSVDAQLFSALKNEGVSELAEKLKTLLEID